MSKFLFLVSFFFILVSCSKESVDTNFEVSGIIFDSSSNLPLKGASVKLIEKVSNETSGSIIYQIIDTDSNGKYAFKDLPAKSYILTCNAEGYQEVTNIIDIIDSNINSLNFSLLKVKSNFTSATIWSNFNTENIYIINSNNQLFKSSDNCNTWAYISTLPFKNILEFKIIGDVMYGSDQTRIYTSTDQGKNWKSIPDTGDGDRFNSFDVDIKTNNIYATTLYALFRYDGKNWTRIKTTTSDNTSECVSIDHNSIIYYSTYMFTINKSADNGVNWSVLNYRYPNSSMQSTTGAIYISDENIVLMNRWWEGVCKMEGNNCIPLNNGLMSESWGKGTLQIVTKNENYYVVLNSTAGIEGIFSSNNRGLQWNTCNYNLTPYDFRYLSNISINKSGTVVISISNKGCYKLNKELQLWELIK